ncbi:MAG: lysophospholipid acyltransferase family protein [Bacteroidales bacterium]|nr:lysophospholipid acyltransferase family protein [Bacteroidales bacterium]
MKLFLSDILFFLAYHVVRYRRKVTRDNLSQAYPALDNKQRHHIEKAYYRHMCDLIIEGIHNLYARPQNIMKHYRFVNRQLVNQYYEQGQSVVLMSSHYNNWEYMITSLNFQLMHHGVGVGKPLQDKAVAGYITRRRARFGTEIVDQTNVRQTMEYYHQHRVPIAYMMLSDQSPNDVHKSFWTMFMNQETPFLYGAEYFARKYDMPVIYYDVTKVRRGYYEVRFTPLCDKPSRVPQYTITSRYISMLKETIDKQPEYWLWSHRRWKRTRPEGMELKQLTLNLPTAS